MLLVTFRGGAFVYSWVGRRCKNQDSGELQRLKEERNKLKEENKKLRENGGSVYSNYESKETREGGSQEAETVEQLKKEISELKAEQKQLQASWRGRCHIIKVLEWNWLWGGWYDIEPQYMGTYKMAEESKRFPGWMDRDQIASRCMTFGVAYVAGYYWDRSGRSGDFYYYPDDRTMAKIRAKYKHTSIKLTEPTHYLSN